jgi:FtsH-binding integral membrane protein
MNEQGWDPEVKKFFRKILNSFGLGLLWMMTMATAGIYLGYGFAGRSLFSNIVFYVVMFISLGFLIWYMHRTWKKN